MSAKRIFLTFLFLIVVAVGSYMMNKKGPLMTYDRVKIGLPLQQGSALAYIAFQKGFFLAEGLDVELSMYPSGKRALEEGLFGSKADIITTSDTPVVFAAFKRNDFKVIATIFDSDNVNRIVANQKSGIHTHEDLRGRRIATQSKSAVHFFLHLFLLEHGIGIADVNLTFLKAEDLPKALSEGRIDALSIREPYVSQTQKILGKDAIVFSSPALYVQSESVIASDRLIRERPEILNKFLRGILRAEAYMKEHPGESCTIITHYLKTECNKLPSGQYRVGLGESFVQLLDDQARWVISDQLDEADEIPDFSGIIDGRWLKNLKPQSVTIIQ